LRKPPNKNGIESYPEYTKNDPNSKQRVWFSSLRI
jgi:hypothetical protein